LIDDVIGVVIIDFVLFGLFERIVEWFACDGIIIFFLI